jgi:transglutaminase-like putative cysteine protease
MVRMQFSLSLQYDVGFPGADFIFNIQAAHTHQQTVVAERLTINQDVPTRSHTDRSTLARSLRLTAVPGPLHLHYEATVDLAAHACAPEHLREVPVAQLPDQVLMYLYPSRYCQSDQLSQLANSLFGAMPHGGPRVQAIQAWVQREVKFQSNTSTSTTSAIDTLRDRMGVCRDFAHLMIALCRALNIPARFTTGTDYGADPALGPPDFHAYVEVYLENRWYMLDPSGTGIPMGFIRIGTGRDAADVSFATIFGPVGTQAPAIQMTAITDSASGAGWQRPVHRHELLSTDQLH